MADYKDVRLFLAGQGVLILKDWDKTHDNVRNLLSDLLELGLEVQCCGNSLKAQAIETLPVGVSRSSMKGLSSWISTADEVVCF